MNQERDRDSKKPSQASSDNRGYSARRGNNSPHAHGRDFSQSSGAGRSGQRRNGQPVRRKTARDAALTALRSVLHEDAYASQALDRALSDVRLSPEDRRLAASLFYFTVENHIYLDWAINHFLESRPEPVVMDILHLAAAQILFMDKIPDHAAVNEAVNQVRAEGRPAFDKLVNGVLRSLIRARDAGELVLPDREAQPEEYLSIKYSLAVPAARRLIGAYGFDMAEEIAAYSPKERNTVVRPNRLKTDPNAFEAYLTREGLDWKRGTVPDAYLLSGAGDLSARPAYREGLFSIQGESAILTAQAAGARPGMHILDACAAPGGKTCYMAEAMGASGRVYAWDIYPHRVELIRAAVRRLGLENVRPSVHDARIAMESMEMMMDVVLVDAPCSGLGVLTEKPDIRFRVNEEELQSLIPLQANILDACASAVRPGGKLVYATCTILSEENSEQVQAFLSRHSEFEPDRDASWIPESLSGRMEDGMLQLLPARDGVEGFFIARLRRRSV